MLTEDRAMNILREALELSGADQTEAVLIEEQTWLTRFAESVINQNIGQEESTLIVTAVNAKKVGLASTSDLSRGGIESAVRTANDISSLQRTDERFVAFPDPETAPKLGTTVTVEPNTEYSPSDMANVVQKISRKAGGSSLNVSGAFRHDIETVAVANSLGVEQYGRSGKGELSLTVSGEGERSGYAIGCAANPATIAYETVAAKAIEKAEKNINPVTLPDGQYTVILEPPAVGQLLLFLGFLGFGGRTMAQGRSFMSGKKGEPITGENITITEEPDNPQFGSLLFDYEGVPKKRLTLIDHGKAGDAAFDSYWAGMMGVEPTGHSVQPNNSYGPYPKNVAIAPGEHTIDEMIASIDRGVLITHFWYINFLNPMQTMITGTTLDGTFLIENGKLGRPIKNMRTNQSILEAFANAEMISKSRMVYPQYASLMLVPAMKITGFNLVQETKEEWEGEC